MNMNAVGIDVSKGKSMVAILRPYGEIVSAPFEIKHTSGNIQSLIEQIKSIEGESRIVMEHTGRYYEPLARELSLNGNTTSLLTPFFIFRGIEYPFTSARCLNGKGLPFCMNILV